LAECELHLHIVVAALDAERDPEWDPTSQIRDSDGFVVGNRGDYGSAVYLASDGASDEFGMAQDRSPYLRCSANVDGMYPIVLAREQNNRT
jgi:hypothetical protein